MENLYSMMDTDMQKAYREGKLQLEHGKIIFEGEEISIIEMNKGEVMASNFIRLLALMKTNEQNKRKGFASINLNIGGWDDVPEPIFEIKEIRRFYQKLVRKVPHLLFYISPINKIPFYILACLCEFELVKREGNFVSPIEMIEKEGTTENLGSTTISVDLPAELGYNMIESIQQHAITVGFEDTYKELPVLYSIIEKTIGKKHRKNLYI